MKEQNTQSLKTEHSVIIENRRTMTISGITDVDSFDERMICLYTQNMALQNSAKP